ARGSGSCGREWGEVMGSRESGGEGAGSGDEGLVSYDVSKYIHGDANENSSISSTPVTPEEPKVDKIILSWIFFTLSDALQKRLVVARPKTAKEAWTVISDLVKDNKRSRTSTLKTELRLIKLGDLTMEAYFQKIESIMTILASLDSPVNDEYVVHYALEGLPEKYNQVKENSKKDKIGSKPDKNGKRGEAKKSQKQ
nr:hybrid signal transduction histidine kinase M [Tanacetum cinerariifolium]